MNLETLEKQVAETKIVEEEKKSKPRVSESSLKQYLTRIRKIYSLMHDGKKMDNIDWLKKADKVIQFVLKEPTWKTVQSRATYINAITSYLRNSKELPTAYKKYSDINKQISSNIQKDKKDNKMTDKEKDTMISWDEILEKTKDITNVEDKALVSVYTLFPPRRIESFRLMRVFTKRAGKVVPDDENYLVLNSKRIPQAFVFNKYKTAKVYGRQEFKLDKNLKAILKAYTDKGKANGSCLFGQANGSCLSQPGFTSKVRNTFKKYTGKPLTVNNLRHSYISSMDDKNLSIADREKIALKMGHSVSTQHEYNRVDLENK